MEFAILCLTFSTLSLVAGDKAKTCQPEDFHYEYTECDSAGGRWRVSVPKPNSCIGGAPNPPIRGKDCSFNCKSGQYLDIQGDQECHPCQPGTYSLGGGMKFDDWTHLPAGFSVESEKLQGPERWGDGDHDDADTTGNCTDEGWRPEGDYVAVYGGVCSSSLVYSVTLVQPGTVMFQYQYNDDNTFFHFLIENDRCQAAHDKESSKWPAVSKKGEWKTVKLNLKTGLNVLYWKRINFGQNHGPVYVRNIEIEGVAYTSECSPCREGTYSDKEGATFCTLCDPNSHSQRGAVRCTPCDPASEYSRKGAAKCEQRPACTPSDYYEYHTPCDDNHKTKTTYKWIQPQICRTDVPESVQLPAEGPPSDCPPCNPGMQLAVGTGCQFCPINTYSDGSVPCRPCPGSTSPNYGYYFHWWNALPQNVTTACFTMSEDACETDNSWIPSGDYIRSGVPKVRDTYFILNVDVGMFREPSGPSTGGKTMYGEVVIVFEANCSEDCHLSFAQEASEASLLQSWEGPQKKQEFRHKVTEQNDYVFSFAFRPSETHDEIGKDNFVKIYSIHVTNLMEGSGGASSCQPCPRGVQDNGCIPCPDGYYIHPNTSQCTACPPNTVIHGDSAWGVETCKPCGNGLRPVKGNKCASDCKFTSGSGREFDFSELGRYVHYIDGSRLFTSSGTQYVHGFNISLCAGDDKFSMATCVNNVTFEETFLKSRSKVESAICRSTMIPAHSNRHMVLSTQPASLGDYLEKIVSNVSLEDIYKEEGFNTGGMENDIHFYYKSDSSTSACKQGRTTIISLRCDVKEEGNGTIDLPPKCSDGTCDGCTFHFLWRTMHACPICTADDYDVIVGECVRGSQTVHYVAPVHCIVADNKKQETKERKCSMVPFAIEIAILVGIGVGIIMCGCLVYCWKKNRKLEYKYMKLVGQDGSGGKYGDELPGVDSCGLDEGEEDEQFDAVHFKESKGKQLLNKLKLKIGGKDDENPFESIALSEKQSLT